MRSRLSMTAALLFVAAPAVAQLSVDVRLGGAHDTLAYSGTEPEGRLATAGTLDAEYLFAGGRARLSYALDAATYSTPGDWGTLRHDLGGVHRTDLTNSGSLRLFLGANARWQGNGDAWSVAGYRALGGMANIEHRSNDGPTLRVGYRLDGRRFTDIPELDQVEHDAFVSALFNFQTRTTLIGEVHLGAKSYAGELIPMAVSPTVSSGRSGRGRGVMGPTGRPVEAALQNDADHAGLVTWRVRVAQSLADRTGLSVDYSARHTSGEVPPALISTPAHFYDDGVYDDPYASNARTAVASLKQVFQGAGVLRGWVAWQKKDYRATPALGLTGQPMEGGDLRQDRVWRAGAGWRVPLFPARTGRIQVDLDLGYAFTDHSSNDAFYDYASHAFGVSLWLAY
ncbi:MAG: hypothetical protein PVJ73_13420 [Acidobacteriota bacterium]